MYLIGHDEAREVRVMLTIYEERGIVKGKRDLVLRQLRHKFGELPERITSIVQAKQTEAELDALFDRVLDAHSLGEVEMQSDQPEQ